MRTDTRIQIAFTYRGQQCRELLPVMPINKGSIAYAAGLLGEIKRKITDDAFDYQAYFPQSPKVREFAPRTRWVLLRPLLERQLALYSKQAENGTLSPSTLLGYSKAINNQLLPQWGDTALADLSPALLRAWIAGLDVTGKRVRNLLTPLRAVLEDAVNDELIEVNPLDRVALSRLIRQTAKKSEYVVDPFDMTETASLLNACRADEWPMIRFWLETGLRPGEMIALKRDAIDTEARLARVSDNVVTGLVDGKAVAVHKTPKTAAGIREVELTALALEAIKAQLQIFQRVQTDRLWLDPRSAAPWTTESQIRKTLWEPLCSRSGVEYRNPYQLRHTFASTRLTAGCNPFWLAGQMGHVDGEMVFKIYGKWIPANYRRGSQFTPASHQATDQALEK